MDGFGHPRHRRVRSTRTREGLMEGLTRESFRIAHDTPYSLRRWQGCPHDVKGQGSILTLSSWARREVANYTVWSLPRRAWSKRRISRELARRDRVMNLRRPHQDIGGGGHSKLPKDAHPRRTVRTIAPQRHHRGRGQRGCLHVFRPGCGCDRRGHLCGRWLQRPGHDRHRRRLMLTAGLRRP